MSATVAVFCMAEDGHFQRMRPLIAGLAHRGLATHVFTHQRYAAQVAQAGAAFEDLFGRWDLEQGPDASLPVPSRYVTFAGEHGREVVEAAAALRPALVVNDAFSVVGTLAAEALRAPHVHVCAGHAVDAAGYRADLATDPRVRTSARCRRAVETLRDEHGVADASPFSYVAAPSPHLNLYCEPPEYLAVAQRASLEPVEFFGSLPPAEELPARGRGEGVATFGEGSATLRVYASVGTVVWRYWPDAALGALRAVSGAVAATPRARAVLSLGHAALAPEDAASLAHERVTVADYTDQWAILQEADVFVTHHGLSSTHEAIFHRVPMLSYPMFWDQPSLAATCQDLGLALPLTAAPRAELTPEDVLAAFERLAAQAPRIRARLTDARGWELRTVAGRDAVLDRIAALI